MKEFAVIHIVENTPLNCDVPLYSIVFDGETIMECMAIDEVKEVTIGELLDAYYREPISNNCL